MFNNILPKLKLWQQNSESQLQFMGLSSEQWYFVFAQLSASEPSLSAKSHLIVVNDIEEADRAYSMLSLMLGQAKVISLPGLENSPYIDAYGNELNISERFNTLNKILNNTKPLIIISTAEALLLKNPPPSFFHEEKLTISLSDIIEPDELATKLINLGYHPAPMVEEPGTFSKRGEIFDIYSLETGPIRIHYFDEMVEEIFKIDPTNQKTLKNEPLQAIKLYATPFTLLKPSYGKVLRANIPTPSPQHKSKYSKRNELLKNISENRPLNNISPLVPLFFENPRSVFDFFNDDFIVHLMDCFNTEQRSAEFFENINQEYERHQEDSFSDNIIPAANTIYFSNLNTFLKDKPTIAIEPFELAHDFRENLSSKILLKAEPFKSFINKSVEGVITKSDFNLKAISFIKEHFIEPNRKCIYTYTTETSKQKFEELLGTKNIIYIKCSLSTGFYYEAERLIVVSEADLFSYKRPAQATTTQNYDLFAEQLSTLKIGDYLIHNTHGVGKYSGLESMDIGGNASDYLVLEYKDKDKVYVPVYKLNLIQKHAGSEQDLRLASLRSNAFQKAKEKARSSVKKLAFDLLKLQAERELAKAYAFSPPDDIYNEFELNFPFSETADQLSAIHAVLADMQKDKPMDHLVCGDVGFGKTEVAIRAAFKAVLDKKQVAVLVPTTLLALQHYHSFSERLKDFPVNIDYLSRFRSPKEASEIYKRLEDGKIDIIIGTHKILSEKLKFIDLGLLIVDEEHKFGVAHKEKLKKLKANIDILTLTATPIPRTMQIAFMGIKGLSLIKTPPPKRQSIKSYVITNDNLTIKKAIEFELHRGGQVFIVHNRVNDIEILASKIRELTPEAKIVIAHGQLPEKELEKRVEKFFAGEYQILVSTVIIESGLDVPNANTMIVNNADNYGLAQLHQLRGRIGRSDKKAYAYFVVEKHKKLSEISQKRLKALITYAELGSGFDIANCDMELRGSGDIIGPEQSGHIESIGLELYSQLLQEEVRSLKGDKSVVNTNIEVAVPFSAYIPNNYITNSALRLKYYKKLSNASTVDTLEEYYSEVSDIYGPLPKELESLFVTLKCRIYLKNCGVKSISATKNSIILQFDETILKNNDDLNAKVFETFISRPKKYKFSPDYKVYYSSELELTPEAILKFSQEVSNSFE